MKLWQFSWGFIQVGPASCGWGTVALGFSVCRHQIEIAAWAVLTINWGG